MRPTPNDPPNDPSTRDQSPIAAVFTCDGAGVIRTWNAGGSPLATHFEAPTGRSIDDVFGGGALVERIRAAIAGRVARGRWELGGAVYETHHAPLPDGTVVTMVVPAAREVPAGGAAEGEQARLVEKLRELDDLKNRFFANVSHELRTPITLILGMAANLRRDLAVAPLRMQRDLDLVIRNARSLHRHVDDLLDIATLEAGRLQADYARVDLAHLLRRTASLFEGFAGERRIRYDVRAPETLLVEVDPDKIERVLMNVLSNAFRHTPEDGSVRCALDVLSPVDADADASANAGRGVAARITIEDDGPAFPEGARDRVFARSFDGAAPETSGAPGRGSGLGLAIAKEFVELHGGTIDVGAPGGTARFVVELPVVAPAGVAVASGTRSMTEAPPPVDGAPVRVDGPASERTDDAPPEDTRPLVLVVEDNREMSRFLRLSLSTTYRVASAPDGERGLVMAAELKPDLVITDMLMPALDGEALVREMRSRADLRDVPVLVITADADEALRVRVLENGAQDYLTKPFAVAELSARAAVQIAMRRARRLLERELLMQNESVEQLASELVKRGGQLRTTVLAMQRAREQAEHASEHKSRFLRLVTHELVTPLTAAKLGLESVRRDPELLPRHATRLQKCASSLKRLHGLIESLLQHARIEGGMTARDVTSFELVPLVGELVDEMRPIADAKNVVLTLQAARPIVLASDPHVIRLIASNLLGNALKFTEKGTIDVRLETTETGAVLEVADTGPGIPETEQGRIFEAFAQLEPLDHKHAPGIGLGLALVREMTALLGGKVELRSEVGKGSVFTIDLPNLALPAHAGATATTAEQASVRS